MGLLSPKVSRKRKYIVMMEDEWEGLETVVQHSDTFKCIVVKYYELVKQERSS